MNNMNPKNKSRIGYSIMRFSVSVSSTYTMEIRPGFICLVDLDIGRSLTNNAAVLIADLVRDGYDLAKNRVVYRDTMGIWDQMLVAGNRFSGFKRLNRNNLDAAIEAASV
jgi:hypothetical protein